MDDLLDFINKASNHKYTEFRLVVMDGGQSYCHVLGKDSETFDFMLPKVINDIPANIKTQISNDIDKFEQRKNKKA